MKRPLTIALAALAITCALAAGAAHAHPASGIVVDREGRVYFSDIVRVWRLDAQGKLSLFHPGNKDSHTHELFVDEAGNVYGTDNLYDPATERHTVAVWMKTPGGEFKYLFAPTADPPRGVGMVRDRAGNTFALERNNAHRKQGTWLVRRSPDGAVTRLAGSSYGHADGRGEKASFGIINTLTLGPDGSVYAIDESYVRRVSPDGTVTTPAADIKNDRADKPEEKGKSAHLSGISVDPQGFVYVADFGSGRVVRIAPDRKAETVFRSERPWTPNGVAWGRAALYVMEYYAATDAGPFHTRVRKLSPDGTSAVVALIKDGVPQPVESPAATKPAAPDASPASEEGRTGRGTAPAFVGAGALVLTLVAWRVRRRGSRPGG